MICPLYKTVLLATDDLWEKIDEGDADCDQELCAWWDAQDKPRFKPPRKPFPSRKLHR